MTKARQDGLYLLSLGALIFLLLGFALESSSPSPMADFKVLFYPARCLVQHVDPYNASEVIRIYSAEARAHATDTPKDLQILSRYMYLPTAFSFTAPFALLPWGPAHVLWLALTVSSFLFASLLIWDLGAEYAPTITGALLGLFLANSELLIIKGNAAGIAISLCVIAVWCFLRERFAAAGVICLALSLAIKPHDTGLVWLYFLLAGGIYRKRALQTLLVTLAISLPTVVWVWHISPQWTQELRTNIAILSVHGGVNDPGVASTGAHGIGMLISLQAVFSVFWDDPAIYNPASYLVCAPLLLVWGFAAIRRPSSRENTWLALAAISALSMLPLYHRQYDAKLLLLTIPACAMLWAKKGKIAWIALLVNAVGFLFTGDLAWAILLALLSYLQLPTTGLSGQMLTGVQVFPAPLILLVMGIFYLWIFLRRTGSPLPASR